MDVKLLINPHTLFLIQEALEIGLESSTNELICRDKALGRSTETNLREATMMEEDISKIDDALLIVKRLKSRADRKEKDIGFKS